MSEMTLRASVVAYLDEVSLRRNPTTARTYRGVMLGFLRYLEENAVAVDTIEPGEASIDWVVGYFQRLEGLSPSSLTVYFWAIYGWYKLLSAQKLSDVDPIELKQTIQKRIPRPIVDFEETPNYYDISRVVNYALALKAKATSNDQERLRLLRDRALILTLADSGLEVGLACRLRICDIDRKTNRLWIVNEGIKTSVHVTPRVLETIFEYLSARQDIDKSFSRSSAFLPVFAQHRAGQKGQALALSSRSVGLIVSKRASEALGAEHDGSVSPKSFRHYAVASLLQPLTALHPKIVRRCKSYFENGQYDDAILNAMKAIEVEVRIRIGADPTEYGVNLITTAMKKEPIQITFSAVAAEQDAHYNLFKGALGSLKNPHSHRFVGVTDPIRTFESLALASLLMRMLDEAT